MFHQTLTRRPAARHLGAGQEEGTNAAGTRTDDATDQNETKNNHEEGHIVKKKYPTPLSFFHPRMPRHYQLTLFEKWCCYLFGYPHNHMKLFAADGIHMNERGCDAWGRYVGEALCDEWEQRSSS